MSQTLTTELYIDSQSTIMNDLKDTFSCKNSYEGTNVLKINTSTYSIARTANHIAHRLQQASKRVANIETSIQKNKSKSILNKSRKEAETKKYSECLKFESASIGQRNNKNRIEKSYAYPNQQDILNIIKRQKQEIEKKNTQIQILQEQAMTLQEKFLHLQEKYLKRQNNLILQINRLKGTIKIKEDAEAQAYSERIQLQRLVDEYQVKLWDMEKKFLDLQAVYAKCKKKEDTLKETISYFWRKSQKEDLGILAKEYKNKKERNEKNFLETLKNIMELQPQIFTQDENKQNDCQISNRFGKECKSSQKITKAQNTNTYGLIGKQKRNSMKEDRLEIDKVFLQDSGNRTFRSGNLKRNIFGQSLNIQLRTVQKQKVKIQVQVQKLEQNESQDLYRMLLIQAELLENSYN